MNKRIWIPVGVAMTVAGSAAQAQINYQRGGFYRTPHYGFQERQQMLEFMRQSGGRFGIVGQQGFQPANNFQVPQYGFQERQRMLQFLRQNPGQYGIVAGTTADQRAWVPTRDFRFGALLQQQQQAARLADRQQAFTGSLSRVQSTIGTFNAMRRQLTTSPFGVNQMGSVPTFPVGAINPNAQFAAFAQGVNAFNQAPAAFNGFGNGVGFNSFNGAGGIAPSAFPTAVGATGIQNSGFATNAFNGVPINGFVTNAFNGGNGFAANGFNGFAGNGFNGFAGNGFNNSNGFGGFNQAAGGGFGPTRTLNRFGGVSARGSMATGAMRSR